MNGPTSSSSTHGSVLIVASEFPPGTGGIGTYAYEISRQLHRLGWDIRVAAMQGFSTLSQVAAFNAALPFAIESLPSAGQRYVVSSLIQQVRVDAVVAADVHSLRWCWWPARRRRIPLVTIGHGSEFLRGGLLSRSIKKVLYRTAAHVVFNSAFTQSVALSHGYRVRRSSIIHPAGGDLVSIDPDSSIRLRERLGLHGRRVIVTVGTVSRRKGQTAVIAALPQILQAFPEAHYLVVGRETDDGEARRLVQELHLPNSVTFAGPLDDRDKAAAYELAEFCILPSRNTPDEVEGFGIVVLEAAARGRPTIGTADTGVAEAIVDGMTGLLVPTATPQELAAAMHRLLGDAPLLKRLSAAAREHSAGQTWNSRAQQWSDLLRGLTAHCAAV